MKSLVLLNLEKPCRKWDSNPGSSTPEAEALTTRPAKRQGNEEEEKCKGYIWKTKYFCFHAGRPNRMHKMSIPNKLPKYSVPDGLRQCLIDQTELTTYAPHLTEVRLCDGVLQIEQQGDRSGSYRTVELVTVC